MTDTGEFVSKPGTRENANKNPELVKPTPSQVIPCSAIGFREAYA